MKKSIAVLLSLLLLYSPAQGAAIVSNGDFEKVTGHKPYAWTLYGGASYVPGTWDVSSTNLVPNGNFELITGNTFDSWIYNNKNCIVNNTSAPKNGTFAIGITGTTGACVYQYIPVMPDTDYLLSAWVYAESGATPSVRLHYLTADNIICGSNDSMGEVPSKGEWHNVSIAVHTPEKAAKVQLYCLASGSDTYAYYDDVALCTLAEEDGFTFETDSIFYYSDETEGTTTVTANGKVEGKTAVFTLSHEGKVVDEKTAAFSGGVAKYVFPLSILSELKKEYLITASVTAADGTKETFSERIYKYNRPSVLGADGVYREEDGKPFYPVIGYHVNESDYNRMPEIGVNVVQVDSNVNRAQLDAFEEMGIKALICLYLGSPASMKPGGHPDNLVNTIDMVKAFCNHPAVFGWASMDEPFLNTRMDIIEVWIRDTYKTVRDIDNKHPVYICQAPAQYYRLAEKYCDVLACDPYSYNDDTAKTTTQTEMALSATGAKKPVYTIAQTYSSSPNWFPSADVIRATAHRAFASGAKGLGYYSISDSTYSGTAIYNELETWNGLRTFADEELDLLFELYTSDKYKEISNSGNADENYNLYYKSWKSADGTVVYMDVHNRSTSVAETVTVPLGSIGGYTVRKAGETSTTTAGGNFSVTLAKGESAVYILTPVTPLTSVNLSSVKLSSVKLSSANPSPVNLMAEENRYISLAYDGAGAMQRVYDLAPYATYTLSLSYKTSVKNALRITADFGVNDGSGYMPWDIYCAQNGIEYLAREASYTESFGTAQENGGEWRTITVDFYTPKHANALSLYIEAVSADPYAAVDNVTLVQNDKLNLLTNGGLDYLKDEETLCGTWLSYNDYMASYGNVTLKDGYIEMRENTADTSANLRQYVYLYAGETYALSFDFLGDEPEASVWYSTQRANTVTEWGKTASSWKRYTIYFTAAETNRYYIWLGGKNTKGTYSYDNIRLAPYEIDELKLFKAAGTIVSGGCVQNVGLPLSEAAMLDGDVFAMANNPDGQYELMIGAYETGNKLSYFNSGKTEIVYIPKEKITTDIRAFLWNDNMQPICECERFFKENF